MTVSFRGLMISTSALSILCFCHFPAFSNAQIPTTLKKSPHHPACNSMALQKIHRKVLRRLCFLNSHMITKDLSKHFFRTAPFSRHLLQLNEVQEEPNLEEEVHLLAFRIIGCSFLTLFVGLTIIIYVTSSMLYQDCVAQICSEICLLIAYTCIMLITTDTMKKDHTFCMGIAIALHFLFFSCFLFMLLEVICMSRMLFEWFPNDFLNSSKSTLLIGWGIPAIVVGISATISYNRYTTKTNCWLNLDRTPFWPTIIPIGVCACLQFILLIPILTVHEVPYGLPYAEYERAKNFLTTRWASIVILGFTTSAWGFGIAAGHYNDESYYGAFTVLSIVLGVVIFIVRISTDYEIRRIMTNNVLCFMVRPRKSNRVVAWSRKVIRNAKPPEKKIAIVSNHVNGDVRGLTNHMNGDVRGLLPNQMNGDVRGLTNQMNGDAHRLANHR